MARRKPSRPQLQREPDLAEARPPEAVPAFEPLTTASPQESALLERFRALPFDRQQEVQDFVDFLRARVPRARARVPLKGVLADAGIDLSDEDLRQLRHER